LYHDLPAPVGGLRKVADGPNSLAVHRLAATPPLQLGNIPRARLERLPFRHQLAREGLLPWRVAGDDRIVGPNIPVRLRVEARRFLAALDRADRVQHQPP